MALEKQELDQFIWAACRKLMLFDSLLYVFNLFYLSSFFYTGIQELMSYMKKEYSHENLRFWVAVQELRTGPGSEAKIKKKVKEIWE